VIGNAIGLTKL